MANKPADVLKMIKDQEIEWLKVTLEPVETTSPPPT